MRATSRVAQSARLFSLPPPPNVSVLIASKISRLLGGRDHSFGSVDEYSGIAAKMKDQHPAIHVGRAIAQLELGVSEAALKDADTAVIAANQYYGKNSDEKDAMVRLAVWVRTRGRAKLLHEALERKSVHGGPTDAEISRLNEQLSEDFAVLAKVAPRDWAVQLFSGELLAASNPKAAQEDFLRAKVALEAELKRDPVDMRFVPATESVIAFRLARARINHRSLKPKNEQIRDAVTALSTEAEALSEALAQLRVKYNASNLSDAETMLVAQIVAHADASQNYFDILPEHSGYFDWPSARAKLIASQINFVLGREASGVESVKALQARLAHVKKPATPSHTTPVELQKALRQAPPDVDLIAYLESQCGPEPSSPICAGDRPFFDTLSTLMDHQRAGSSPYAQPLGSQTSVAATLILSLLRQARSRAEIGLASALFAEGDFTGATAALDAVIAEDEYLPMWQALQLRGTSRKALGLVDQAESDFRQLHSLVRPRDGADIPRLDRNRHRSAF